MPDPDALPAPAAAPRRAKQLDILALLRRELVEGTWPAGTRLPTREELAARLTASPVTIQKALDHLIEEGFVETRRRGGTCVREDAPHLCRFGLVVPMQPGSKGWVGFWTALCNEASRIAAPNTMTVYYGIDGRMDQPDYLRLLNDVADLRLAGILFTSPPHQIEGSPILDQTSVPRVCVTTHPEHRHIPAVGLDSRSFVERALDYLASKGRKRIGVLTVPSLYERFEQECAGVLSARGQISKPYWVQMGTQREARGAQRIIHLLMRDPNDRPDGLIITDDNMVESATAGLVAAGARVPEDVEVVAHCNFPWPPPTVLPVKRLGYDSREILRTAIRLMQCRRRREPTPPLTLLMPRFEEELEQQVVERQV